MQQNRRARQVFVSLGSNMGERIQHLSGAIRALRELACGSMDCSAVYETTPVGFVDQPDFLNMVVSFPVEFRPLAVIERLQAIEQAHGRERSIRFGPRTLDLDLLLYENEYVCFRDLQVPHPRMWERAFVLVPLAELAPQRRALGGETVRNLAHRVTLEGEVRYVGRFW